MKTAYTQEPPPPSQSCNGTTRNKNGYSNCAGIQTEEDAEEEDDLPRDVVVESSPDGRYKRFDRVLGRGAFKTVYKGFDEEEGREIVWNQVVTSEPGDKDAGHNPIGRLFSEVRVLNALKHRNIMAFYDSWYDVDNGRMNFITELFTSGTLRQFRAAHKDVDDGVLRRWLWQVLQGLVYLHGHSPPIIHRDIKCDNLFVNGASGVVKIGDLGLATLWDAHRSPRTVLGTPEFMAPEAFEGEYDQKIDVYAFGMCALELLTCSYPFAECRHPAQVYKKVLEHVPPAALQVVKDPQWRSLIEACIHPLPERRPETRALLKHAFFDSVRPSSAHKLYDTQQPLQPLHALHELYPQQPLHALYALQTQQSEQLQQRRTLSTECNAFTVASSMDEEERPPVIPDDTGSEASSSRSSHFCCCKATDLDALDAVHLPRVTRILWVRASCDHRGDGLYAFSLCIMTGDDDEDDRRNKCASVEFSYDALSDTPEGVSEEMVGCNVVARASDAEAHIARAIKRALQEQEQRDGGGGDARWLE